MRAKNHWLGNLFAGKKIQKGRRSQRPSTFAALVENCEPRVMLSAAHVAATAASQFAPQANGFLSGQDFSQPSTDAPVAIAKGAIVANAEQFGLTRADVSSIRVTDTTQTSSGATVVYLRQQFNGIDISGADANVVVAADGKVLAIGNRFYPDIGQRISTEQGLTAAAAVISAARELGIESPRLGNLAQSLGDVSKTSVFSPGNVSKRDVTTKQVYQEGDDGKLYLSWNFNLQMPEGADWFDVNVSARSGQILSKSNWTHYDDLGTLVSSQTTPADALTKSTGGAPSLVTTPRSTGSTSQSQADGTGTYNVFPFPMDAPSDPTGVRSIVTAPFNPTASPFGWHDTNGVTGAESTLTTGNNVSAQEDQDANNTGGFRPDGGTNLNFDFPFDPASSPTSNMSAAITQLFYANNMMHDILYNYGFNEASGNFQVNNYGKGGLGNDAVQADALDGSGTNNANFSTPPDGIPGRMQQFIFTLTNPNRDSDLDNGVIAHEYGHGVSNRLTGGPSNANALNAIQSGGMGEGWSDFWALMVSQRAGDSPNVGYGLGTYVLGQPNDGPGIRRHPYSFNMTINPTTLADYNNSQEVHDSGEIIASALWDLNWLLIDKKGFDADLLTGTGGNNLTMQLVIDAMKIQPVTPSFLEFRDAMLTADQIDNGGANAVEIWTAFARRGMGFSAVDNGADALSVTPAFDLPSTPTGTISFDQPFYSAGETVTIKLADSDLAALPSINVTVVSTGGDSEVVTLFNQSVSGFGVFSGSIITSQSALTNDGVLQVTGGNKLSVTYHDAHTEGGTTATVTANAKVVTKVTDFYADFQDQSNPSLSSLDGFTIDNTNPDPQGGPGLWHLSQGHAAQAGHTGPYSMYFGTGENSNGGGTFDTGVRTAGRITSPIINLSANGPSVLSFSYFLKTENLSGYDIPRILVSANGGSFVAVPVQLLQGNTSGSWNSVKVDLSSYSGQAIKVQFDFDSIDAHNNNFEGWYVDDVRVEHVVSNYGQLSGTVFNDVNSNGGKDPGEAGRPNWQVFLDQNGNGVPDQATRIVPKTINAEVPMPDLSTVASTIVVDDYFNLSDLTVTVDISHTFDGDLSIRLMSPGGIIIPLSHRHGGGGDDYSMTTFDDSAGTAIADGVAPFSGSYRPDSPLSVLAGTQAHGAWILFVEDVGGGDSGTFHSWGLTLKSVVNEPVTTTNAQGVYTFNNLPEGAYQVRDTLQPGYVRTVPASGVYNIVLGQDEVVSGLNFGNVVPSNNKAPVISGFDGSVTYVENAAGIVIDGDALVSDVDSANFETGKLTIQLLTNVQSTDRLEIRNQGLAAEQIGVDGANVLYAGSVIGTFTGGSGGTPLVITFNATAKPAIAQALLRNVTYRNISDAPSVLPRTVRVTLTDGDGGTSNLPTKTINVTATNDAPTVTAFDGTVTYVENAVALVIDSDAVITDVDSANFESGKLTIQLLTNVQSTDRLEIRNQGLAAGQIGVDGANVLYAGTVIGTFTGGSGATPLVITFNATTTPAIAQAVLRNLTYRNVSDVPSVLPRTVRVSLTDGDGGTSNLPTKTINVTATNDAPTVTAFDGDVTYVENAVALVIDGDALITDLDSANFETGKLTIQLLTNVQSTDRLEIRNQGLAAGQIGVDGTNVLYAGSVIGTFTGGSGGTPLVITFNATTTPVIAQALLRTLTYRNISDAPSVLPRTVRVSVTDGDGGTSNLPTKTINVTAINDAPIVAAFDGAVTYVENAAGILIDGDALITDLDSTNFETGKLTIQLLTNAQITDRLEIRNQGLAAGQIGVDGANVLYAGTVIGTFAGGSGGTPLVITFNAAATPAIAQVLLRNLTYSNVSDAPSVLPRTVRVTLTDGDGGTSNLPTKTINVTATNDAPTVTAFDGDVTYVENAVALVIDSDALITDVDSANFEAGKLTIQLLINAQSTDRLEIRNQGLGAGQIGVDGTNVLYAGSVIGTFAGGSGATPLVITFNATATPAIAQTLLRNLTYRNISDTPSVLPRTVRVSLTDGDGGASNLPTKTINVTAVNDAPTVTGFDGDVTYVENAAGILIDGDALITDVDSANFDSGKLTIQLLTNVQSTDRLEIRNQGLAAGQIGVDGTNVLYAGSVIGTFTGGSSGTPLVITFNATATPAIAQALLRNLTYRNVSDAPSALPRSVRISLTDGDGGTSNLPTKTINVTAVNDAPTIAGFDGTVTYIENAAGILIDSDALITDLDSTNFETGKLTIQILTNVQSTDRLEVRNQGLGAGQIGVDGANVLYAGTVIGTFTGGSGGTQLEITFNGAATPAIVQVLLRNLTYRNASDAPWILPRAVRISLTDGDGGTSNLPTKTINVTAINDAPTITSFDGNVSYVPNSAGELIDSDAQVADVDSTDFDGGKLTIQLVTNAQSSDLLEIRNQGLGVGQIGVDGANVLYVGSVIGTFTGGGGGTPLVITFNATATPAIAQAVLRNLTYRNTSATPSPLARTVRLFLTDGDGGTSTQLTKTINFV